ncbi:MAG: phage head-tail connector protein [Parvularculaceae bacterium]|nr:phage head-tail connector protein [Parvularculaceae bacterium]
MSLELITPPAEEPLSLADLKAHLRVAHSEEDALILSFARAARHAIEARYGLAVILQEWRWRLDRAPLGAIVLPRSPLVAVNSVSLVARDGSAEPVDPALYEVETGRRGRLFLHGAVPWAGRALGALQIDFSAGAPDAAAAPPEIKTAIALIVAHFFENREAGAVERIFSTTRHLESLLGAYREPRL